METHSYSSVNYNGKDKLNCGAGDEKKRDLPGLLLLKMKTKLRAIGALVGRRFFLSFCYCFRFWFSFSFNSCLHSSSSSPLCYPLVFSVFLFRSCSLKTKVLTREGWLTHVPLCFCFFLSHLFWSPVFSLSLCSSSFSPLCSLDSCVVRLSVVLPFLLVFYLFSVSRCYVLSVFTPLFSFASVCFFFFLGGGGRWCNRRRV